MKAFCFFFTFFFCISPAFTEDDLRIRDIHIQNLGVFDSTHKSFRWWGFRFLNRLHVKTRKGFIANELLVQKGDLLLPDLLRESERNLRRYSFLTDVSVRSVRVNDHEVDVYVKTEDQWTTKPTLSWGRARGSRTFDLGIDEENFLGLGRRVAIRYEKAREREGISGIYGDPRFLNTRLRLNLRYSHLSDGHRLNYGVAQPFYSQQARWSYGMDGSDSKRLQHFYYRGTDAAAIEQIQRHANFELVHAWGKRYHRNRFGMHLGYAQTNFPETYIYDDEVAQQEEIQRNLDPDNHELFNFGISMVRDRQKFVKFYYMDNFGRTEDLPYGTSSGFAVTHSNDHKGHDFVTGNFHGRYTRHFDAKKYFVSHANFTVRREAGEWNNWIADFLVRYYGQSKSLNLGVFRSPTQTLALNLAATITADVDAPYQLSLGEDEGLRGYTFRDFTGLNRALFNAEYRVLVPWENRLVALSVVPFSDSGYVWNPNDQFGASVGIGLRIGLKKYGRTRVFRIDYAFPLVNKRGRGASLSISSGQAFEIL